LVSGPVEIDQIVHRGFISLRGRQFEVAFRRNRVALYANAFEQECILRSEHTMPLAGLELGPPWVSRFRACPELRGSPFTETDNASNQEARDQPKDQEKQEGLERAGKASDVKRSDASEAQQP
jgi:hypothetical protein